MRDVLIDIQAKLRQGAYQNEEHVRLSLVTRILQGLGWDVWNPREVCPEFAPVRGEDNTKVDFALLLRPQDPSAFIETKPVGRLMNRQEVEGGERQLRDYNRNMTALFCVLTDGRMWRFYLSHTSGDFASKCFKTLDLLSANADDSEAALTAYLSKAAIASGQAKKSAEILLDLTKKERAMEECLPQARRRTQDPPYPSLPDALVSLVADQGFEITRQEAEEFIARSRREVGVIAPPLNADGGPPPPPPPPPASAASSAATCARTSD